ncbi:3'-5' exonuclease [Wohlfahrtiimonas chitiniclastica]|uniref:3'-5' exonuclease n=1 Tax=Wohlfahrtiimonas chitiniclastica TaxID=400946 RepID=UPI001BCE84C5|nr:3'-5' exonuclease [Wohlfahrtiimonas chitiniclastica]MBS7827426.1 3'-5' exonuclease [Wohlfahrtiimonas chitiniclastica]
MSKKEIFISVDIETSGPIIGEHSMLTIGACFVYNPDIEFAIMLQPISDKAIEEALKVSGITLEQASKEGLPPKEAMSHFESWLIQNMPENAIPIFVGLNAPFDWSFINFYFLKYLNRNPFGISAIDIKALFMGATKCSWHGTKSSLIDKYVNPTLKGDHNALHDAQYQAELFRLIREKQ